MSFLSPGLGKVSTKNERSREPNATASYCGDYESCELLSPSLPIFREAGESLLTSYGRFTSVYEFTSVQAFRRCCLSRERNYQDGSSNLNEYILFTGVTQERMSMVDTARRLLPKMRCLYDVGEEVLIVKLVVSSGHENMTWIFIGEFYYKLRNLGLVRELPLFGSTRFGDTRRRKETQGDGSFKPQQTCPGNDDWPSMMLEVGLSESLQQLRLDAYYWLTQSPPHMRTNIVILIHIKKIERQIQIERWEVVNPQRPQPANIPYLPSVGCVQTVELREGIVYVGPPLELSIQKVFDTLPPNLALGALDYTAVDLQFVNDTFWPPSC